jgi:hypothetical protein
MYIRRMVPRPHTLWMYVTVSSDSPADAGAAATAHYAPWCYPHAMDRDAQLAYCLVHIVPIWERWTEGNMAARRLLESANADPASHGELFGRLMATTHALRTRGTDASTEAALAAASVCCDAYIGVPADRFEAACTRATAAHITALVADGEAVGS